MEPVYYTTSRRVTFTLRESCVKLMAAYPNIERIYRNAVSVMPLEERRDSKGQARHRPYGARYPPRLRGCAQEAAGVPGPGAHLGTFGGGLHREGGRSF